jgi:3-dehydroquinate dehydratase / shikimate dehydrogenase
MISIRSLPRICVALGCAERPQLERLALHACDSGEDFLEIRLDMLQRPNAGIAVIRRLLRRYPETLIVATCRRKANGGAFAGSLREELEVLETAGAAGAALLDVEIETAEAAPEAVAALRQRARLIVSYHNFERTPALTQVLKRMKKVPADVYKFATTARKPSDNLRVLSILSACPEAPVVALAMGEIGIPSRILGPARNSLFTFAAPDPAPSTSKRGAKRISAQPTAPGQYTACKLRNWYQVHKRRGSTKVYGVIADPVAHSLSPLLHNRAFRSRRLDAVYLPFQVPAASLTDFFRVVEELPLAGFSVTIPHKQRVARHLASVDALAKRIGAVNTVFRRGGRLCGTNTDALGVTGPLEKRMRLAKAKALVVGNGGAARGAIFALLDKGAEVTLTGRNTQRVCALARSCGVEAIDRERLERHHFDVLIHATPLGMQPNTDNTFFSGPIPADVVFDMVYNPLETKLLKNAREQGKETIAGLEMFLTQAAAQFEIWTGERAPQAVMRDAMLEVLVGKQP